MDSNPNNQIDDGNLQHQEFNNNAEEENTDYQYKAEDFEERNHEQYD